MTALPLAVVGITAIVAGFWRLTRSARTRRPHHTGGPLADRTWPLA